MTAAGKFQKIITCNVSNSLTNCAAKGQGNTRRTSALSGRIFAWWRNYHINYVWWKNNHGNKSYSRWWTAWETPKETVLSMHAWLSMGACSILNAGNKWNNAGGKSLDRWDYAAQMTSSNAMWKTHSLHVGRRWWWLRITHAFPWSTILSTKCERWLLNAWDAEDRKCVAFVMRTTCWRECRRKSHWVGGWWSNAHALRRSWIG